MEKIDSGEKIEMTLMEVERAYTSSPITSAVFGAYVLYIAHNTPNMTELKDILAANSVSPFLSRVATERIGEHWDRYRPLLTMFSQSDLADYLEDRVTGERLCEGGRKGGITSSLPVVELAAGILGIKPGESVCDLGCSVGDFIHRVCLAAHEDGKGACIVGYEIIPEAAAIAEIRMRMAHNDLNVRIEHMDVFDQKTWGDEFDKVFCEPPHGLRRLPESAQVQKFIGRKYPDFPEMSLSMAGDWLFAARAAAAMKDGGRAIVILPPSAMFGVASESYRRYFIQRNLIEAVVELPVRIFEHTGISTYLVVFKRGSESVKMVSAGDLYEKGRRNNVITREHVDVIMLALGLLKTDAGEDISRYVVEVDKQELLKNDCDLSVKKRFADPVAVRNGVSFGSFVESAKRGATITSAELDELAFDGETDCLYVAPGNISDGVMDSKLLCLKEIPKKYMPYCAQNGDIVIARVSASGAGFKVAVVELPEGKRLLPNGNLLVISVDRERTDPYFIKACLDNEYAQSYLQKFSVGSSVVTLNYKNLENLPVPDLPLARQREVSEASRTAAKRIAELREKLSAAKTALGNVLSETAPECIGTSK